MQDDDAPYPGFSAKCPKPIGRLENEPPEKRARLDGQFVVSRRESLYEISLGPLEFFTRQRFAIARRSELVKSYPNARVFSQEISEENGGRHYIVTTLERFWYWYTNQAIRNIYEVIELDKPCRLYFDLEYSKEINGNIDHQRLYEYFIETNISLLKELFDVEVQKSDFLALDSSNDAKFSCHLIGHLTKKDYLFANNVAIGSYTKQLKQRLLDNPPQRIFNADGQEIVLFDEGVYTKNRNFRLFLSTKLGKDRFLKHAMYCTFYGSAESKSKQIFFDALCVPANLSSHENILPDLESPLSRVSETASSAAQQLQPLEYVREGNGLSPFIELEEFLLQMFRRWKPDVYMRQWKVTIDKNKKPIITFYPANCRYCFKIGRQHKSNSQFWAVNVSKGDVVQRCFDPDCRSFTSNYFPIPKSIMEATRKRLNADKEAEENEDPLEILLESKSDKQPCLTQWNGIFDE
ncbi:unnamed protein product, partial [Mesorhabditis belari]|uniref:DNA-directed primase/polymerase protein n=1 Tax=Mesorhabditis belari TaxID=2138241 RepID=A0AAF3EUA3_9BILA